MKTLYDRYAGKAMPGGDGDRYHLLAYHSLDVAAVGWHLMSPQRPLAVQLSARLDMAPDELRRFFVFFLGLHDLGKFSRAFQSVLGLEALGMAPSLGMPYTQRHDRLGAVLWQACWFDWLIDGTLGWTGGIPDRPIRRGLQKVLPLLTAPFFGHHGQPVAAGALDVDAFFGVDEMADDKEAARCFVADWAPLIEPAWPTSNLLSEDWLTVFKTLSWTVAGWATLSDWLGSDRRHFAYCERGMPLVQYWPRALHQAELALADTGFGKSPCPRPYSGLSAWFDSQHAIEPTSLQSACETVEVGNAPQLFILEDVTGSGKTEAAFVLVQRLLSAGRGEGLYFALPTMATSNAMYSRLGDVHRKFYSTDSDPSFVLAHGARELNDDFARAVMAAHPQDTDYTAADITATTRCNRWLADSRKKSLLADVGVGTIDQALMGLLPFRHQSMRLYGLARKVLVVDEVHAYDPYMRILLEQLLVHHARQGGSAVLLTATLPLNMRDSLVAAWHRGIGCVPVATACEQFPLLTHVQDGTPLERPVATRESVARCVGIDWLADESQALDRVLAAVEAGECIVWVRNTVDDAIRVYQRLLERHPDPERCLLFHSRFAMIDRQAIESSVIARFGKQSRPAERRGQVLISTQVFQESLDCDADRMVSDIAPIDLLIQRAGRLQRHARGGRCAPELQILAPLWSETPDEQWLFRALPGTQAVYRDTSIIWLSQRVLREHGAIVLPDAARTLIEAVYGDVADAIPDALQISRYEQLGLKNIAGSMARFNALSLDDGYRRDHDVDQWQEELEMGTRLADEPNINVVLLKRGSNGDLVLWGDAETHADMLSQCRLRQSQAAQLQELNASDQSAWEMLKERYRGLRFTRPWLPADDAGSEYDARWGLLVKRGEG